MITYLSAGILLGLSAGFSPGPLMTLVITQTLRHGIREGGKVAAAPLVTDLPIILTTMLLLSRLANYRPVIGSVSLIGGLFVMFLAAGSFRAVAVDAAAENVAPQSLGRGVAVNLLSPYPYLFWLTVGGPMIVKGWGESPESAGAFLAGFYVCLVGAKLAVAVAAGKSRQVLRGKGYRYSMQLLGALLVAFGALLVKDGLEMLGLL